MAEAQSKTIPPNLVADLDTKPEDEDVTIQVESAGPAETETGGQEKTADSVQQPDAAEEEARQAGWVSEDEWKERHNGSAKGWKPASDFMEFRAGFLPIVSRENKQLRAELDTIKKERAEEKRQNEENRTNYERANLKAQLKQARDDNDWDKVDEISDKLLDIKVAEKAPAKTPAAQTIDPEVRRDFDAFSAQNPWLTPGSRLGKLFAAHLETVMRAGAADNYLDAMETAKKMLKASFPEEFPAARKTAMVENRGENGHVNGTTRSWSQLKADVKEEYEKFLVNNPKITKATLLKEFPADYFRS